MSLQLKVCRDVCGTWSVHGLSLEPVEGLPSLSASIDYAREACDAVPATIELVVDGMYIVIHQERGWPRSPCALQSRGTQSALLPDRGSPPVRSRFLAWLRPAASRSKRAPPGFN
jgi:hypothetical protein